jgi:3-deoxy-manno-octulosonate cytidylyltransferase (CMP-KDO synthetase)
LTTESAPGFIALIPARLASTRLPDKPLADIAGRPMVVRVAERAARSGARRVVIATDSDRIAALVRENGFEALLTRSDHVSGTDRLAEAAEHLALDDREIVLNVQGDEPLIPPGLIQSVASCLVAAPDCAMATAAHPITTQHELLSPHIVKVVINRLGRALYFSRAPIPFERDAATGRPGSESSSSAVSQTMTNAGLPLRHVGLYAYRAGFLRAYPKLAPAAIETIESLEQLRALWHGASIAVHVTTDAPPGGVDTPEDLERIRRLWSEEV